MATSENFLTGCIRISEELLEQLHLCKNKGMGQREELQSKFEIATNYKIKLLEYARAARFDNIGDEIIFFKKIKPIFSAEIEYFSYCYHVLLFEEAEPPHTKQEIEIFYSRQLQRLEKFKKDNYQFYAYMAAEKTNMDILWFTRQPSMEVTSSHDKLAGTYFALLRYKEWIELKLQDVKLKS